MTKSWREKCLHWEWDFHRRIFPYRKQGVKFVSCAEEKVMDLAFLSMAEMNLQKMEVCGKRFWKNIFRKWK